MNTAARWTVVGVLAVAGAAPMAGQRPDTLALPDTSVFRVEGIRVQATRPVTTVGGASAVEALLDSLALSTSPSVEEVLRALPLVHVRTNSRGEAEVSVRGSESRQVAVLLDGVPLSLGWDARTDVSILPAGAATEVSVVRGLSSILHGPNVLGGVVELNVGRARDASAPTWSVSMGLDERGGGGATVLAAHPIETDGGRATVRAGIGVRRSPGLPLARGIEEPVPDPDGLRLNTDMQNLNGFLSVRYSADGGAWGSVSAAGFEAERGIAAELGASEPRLWRYPNVARTVVAASAGSGFRDTPWGRGDVEISLGLDDGSSLIESFSSRAYDEVRSVEKGDGRTLTLRLLADHSLGSRGDLRATFSSADIRHASIVDGIRAEYQQRLTSVAGETVWQLLSGPAGPLAGLRVSLGGAWDRGTTPKSGGLPSLGTLDDWAGRIGLSGLLGGGGTLVHASLSRRGRFPSLRETYSEAIDRFDPNPDLRPERLVAIEAGVTTRLGAGDLQVVAFDHALDGAIRRITLPDGRRRRVNADELLSRGLEVLVSQAFGRVSVGADLMLQNVELVAPGSSGSTRAENVPEQVATLRLALPLAAGLSASTDLAFTGAQFCQDPDSGADVELTGGTWLDAGLAWASGLRNRRVDVRLSASNLGNTALYDQCGLPRPGRSLQLQFKVF